MTKQTRGISSLTVKLIAVLFMAIDHFAAGGTSTRLLVLLGCPVEIAAGTSTNIGVYLILRILGRISFPLFCFCIAEGVFYTKNTAKYAGRLFVLGLLSEIPFDLLFHNSVLEFTSQNVYFTLLCGLIPVWILKKRQGFNDRYLWFVFSVFAMGCLAEFLQTDYGAAGVLAIGVFGFARFEMTPKTDRNTERLVSGAAMVLAILCLSVIHSNYVELLALPAVPVIMAYNGTKGYTNRFVQYGFYAFYPAHLLLFWMCNTYLL